MLNASNAVENQKVIVCRLSDENRSLIIKSLDIAWNMAVQSDKIPLANALGELETLLKASKEIWLLSKS